MPNMTVVIQCDEDGQYSVGVEPEESQEHGGMTGKGGMSMGGMQGGDNEQAEGERYMEPAKSLDDALAKARQLFESSPDKQAAEGEKQAAFESGYKDMGGKMGMM